MADNMPNHGSGRGANASNNSEASQGHVAGAGQGYHQLSVTSTCLDRFFVSRE